MIKPLRAIWNWMQNLRAPLPIPNTLPAVPAPVPPMRQEQFPNVAGAVESGQKRDATVSALNKRLVQANNAHVTRDYGLGPVVEHCDNTVAPITSDELKALDVRARPASFRPSAHLVECHEWRCDEP